MSPNVEIMGTTHYLCYTHHIFPLRPYMYTTMETIKTQHNLPTPSDVERSYHHTTPAGGRGGDSDYLAELGSAQQYNINVTHGV